jgi:hypothetical protein
MDNQEGSLAESNSPMTQEVPSSPKEKKDNSLLAIIIVLLFCILCVGGSYVYMQYFAPTDVDRKVDMNEEIGGSEVEEETVMMDKVELELLGQDKLVSVNLPTSTLDGMGYESLIQENSEILLYEDNQSKSGSSAYKLSFFVDEKLMTDNISGFKATYPLEEVTIDGVKYEYIEKEDYSDVTGVGSAIVYNKEETEKVGGYEAFKILSYYHNFRLENKDNVLVDSTVTTYCVFDLSQISSDANGFLVFSGIASAGSEVNYCEILKEAKDFSITITDL